MKTSAPSQAVAAALALATATAKTAEQLASAKVATDINSAALMVDIGYIKKSIERIEITLVDLPKMYVSVSALTEHSKIDADHESRIRILEASMWKLAGMSSVGGAGLATIVSYSLKLMN